MTYLSYEDPHETVVTNNNSNVYLPNVDDIGAWIMVTAQSLDEDIPGVATAKHGPITIDSANIRRRLEYILAAQGTKFSIYI